MHQTVFELAFVLHNPIQLLHSFAMQISLLEWPLCWFFALFILKRALALGFVIFEFTFLLDYSACIEFNSFDFLMVIHWAFISHLGRIVDFDIPNFDIVFKRAFLLEVPIIFHAFSIPKIVQELAFILYFRVFVFLSETIPETILNLTIVN